MNITKVTTTLVAAGLLGAAATADVRQTPLNNSLGTLDQNANRAGFALTGGDGFDPPEAAAGNLYDNTAGPSVGFFDWADPTKTGWSDDLHALASAPAVVTCINYAYFNTGGFGNTVNHVIKLYDMTPPSGTHGNSSINAFFPLTDVGALLGSANATLAGVGSFSVSITGLNIPVPNNAVWLVLDEPNGSPSFAGPSFWLSGGIPTVGTSNDTLANISGGTYEHYPHALAPYSNIMASVGGGGGPSIPTVSEWGLIIMTGLLLAGGAMLVVRRSRTQPNAA